jgi:hypothetical protein
MEITRVNTPIAPEPDTTKVPLPSNFVRTVFVNNSVYTVPDGHYALLISVANAHSTTIYTLSINSEVAMSIPPESLFTLNDCIAKAGDTIVTSDSLCRVLIQEYTV